MLLFKVILALALRLKFFHSLWTQSSGNLEFPFLKNIILSSVSCYYLATVSIMKKQERFLSFDDMSLTALTVCCLSKKFLFPGTICARLVHTKG